MLFKNFLGLLLLFLQSAWSKDPPDCDAASSACITEPPAPDAGDINFESPGRFKRLSNPYYNEETIQMAKYMVSIRSRTARMYYGDNHFCGGVILSSIFVLTAARCMVNRRRLQRTTRNLLIVAGTPNRLKFMPHSSFHTPVKKILLPDNFTIYNTNDIALLLTKFTIPTFHDSIDVIGLPRKPPETSYLYYVVGWGKIFAGGPVAANIVHNFVRLLNEAKCLSVLGLKESDILCSYEEDVEETMASCDGDLGNPLVHNNTVYGVVSSTAGCADFSLPSLYTDVFKNLEWITRRMTFDRGHTRSFSASLVLLVGTFVFI